MATTYDEIRADTRPCVLNKNAGRTPGVYIGRPSMWGNPFAIGRDGSRADVIAKYEAWLDTQPQLISRLHLLSGRNLICFCAPLACHGDVLLRRSNQLTCNAAASQAA